MRKKTCIEWFESNLKAISEGKSERKMKNIALIFTEITKAGEYDKVSDAYYEEMRDECESFSECWKDEEKATRAKVFANAIEQLHLDQDAISQISAILAESYRKNVKEFVPDDKFAEEESHFNDSDKLVDGKAVESIVFELDKWANHPIIARMYREKRAEEEFQKQNKVDNPQIKYEPQSVFRYLSEQIYGQTDAVKAASMLLYNHVNGHKRNILFAGPTGCGKTEIWRTMSKIYPYIKIVDSSVITQSGWSGNFKVADIFADMPREEIEKSIIVFDEFDKLCEPKHSSGGENVSASIQNELLKLIEGADIYYNVNKNPEPVAFNSSHISFVFCGSFEEMLKKKGRKEEKRAIGFGSVVEKTGFSEKYNQIFMPEDLVKYGGVRNEIAGRINQIIQLYPMSAEDYMRILENNVISPVHKLEREYGIKICMDNKLGQELAAKAADTHLGMRYLHSQIQLRIDELMFEDCTKESYNLGA